MCLQTVGGEPGVAPRHPRRVAEGAGDLALPGAHLQLSGHHGSDAGGGTSLRHRRQELARDHEAGDRRQARTERARHRQDARETAQVERPARAHSEGTWRHLWCIDVIIYLLFIYLLFYYLKKDSDLDDMYCVGVVTVVTE